MTEEQKAVETEDQSQTGTEGDDALDLEALLSETEEVKPEPTTDKPLDTNQKIDRLFSRQEEQDKSEAARQFKEDIGKATGVLKEALPEALRGVIPDSMAKGFLIGQAEDDPRLAMAFAKRDTNPKAWNAAVKAIAKQFAEPYENLPDPATTEDREAVRAAARSTQTQPDPELDAEAIGKMTKTEFDAVQRKHGVRPYGT